MRLFAHKAWRIKLKRVIRHDLRHEKHDKPKNNEYGLEKQQQKVSANQGVSRLGLRNRNIASLI